MMSGRGFVSSAAMIPTLMSVPPRPVRRMSSTRVTFCTPCTSASTVNNVRASSATLADASMPRTSPNARARSSILMDPEVSMTTATWGTWRSRPGNRM